MSHVYFFSARIILVAVAFVYASTIHAQTLVTDEQAIIAARVVRIVRERIEHVAGTEQTVRVQTIEARADDGGIYTFEYDLSPLLRVEDDIFIKRTVTVDGDTYITFQDHNRLSVLSVLAMVTLGAFALLLGKRSWRALLSFGLSLGGIFFVLVPLLAKGYPALPLTLGIAGGILALSIFLTHGRGAHATIAFAGTCLSVSVTALLATYAVSWARFSGTGSDAAVYLNVSTLGALDLPALLLSSIIIGMLGVLDDIAVTQAAVVEELARANTSYTAGTLYVRAMRVGQDHIASLVNTLAFAYVGTALPLVLLLSLTETSRILLINQELVADDIARLLVGTCGLILTVPVTTAVAVWWYAGRRVGTAQ